MTPKSHLPLFALCALLGCQSASDDENSEGGDRSRDDVSDESQPGQHAGDERLNHEDDAAGLPPLRSNVERDTSPDISQSELAQLAADNANFGFTLLRALREGDESLVFSPHSLSVAFAMVYAGANGTTHAQIASTLSYNLPEPKLHAGFNALELALASRNLPEEGEFSALTWEAVNAVWTSDKTVRADYLDVLAENYGAGVYSVDLTVQEGFDTINAAVSDWTHGRIPKLLDFTPGAKLVLTNTVYLNAPWQMAFDSYFTHKSPFELANGETTELDTMDGDVVVGIANVDGLDVVSIPYRDSKLVMTILMPPRTDYENFIDTLDHARFRALTAQEQQALVHLSMPKFKVKKGTDLRKHLMALGMIAPFENADFSRMSTAPRAISRVVHEATLEVSEAGTEAAAATAIAIDTPVSPDSPLPPRLEINRPFVFAVRDVPTGALLFLGTFEGH